MSAISRTNTFTDGTDAYGSQVETEISTIVNAWNNHNSGTSTWTVVSALNASAVPLIADNSSGTNDIVQFKDNGSVVLRVADGGDIYTTTWTDYSSTTTLTGWSSTSVKKVFYKKIGKTVLLFWSIEGTSDATATSFTLPFTRSTDSGFDLYSTIGAQDSGAVVASPVSKIASAGTSIEFFKDITGTVWTASGAKRVYGQFIYQSA